MRDSLTLYQAKNIREWIRMSLSQLPKEGRGELSKISKHLNVQTAFVSQVMSGKKNFSIDQAADLADYFGLRGPDKEYLILMVQGERASSPSLRNFIAVKLNQIKNKRIQLRNILKLETDILPEDQAKYYSSWHFQAVRMLLTIPKFQRPDELSKALDLPIKRIREILSFFVAKELAVVAKSDYESYRPTQKQIHLDSNSPFITQMHTNWRVMTLRKLDENKQQHLHYSGVVTLSEKDAGKVRSILAQAIKDSHETIKPSPEEQAWIMSLDFFQLA